MIVTDGIVWYLKPSKGSVGGMQNANRFGHLIDVSYLIDVLSNAFVSTIVAYLLDAMV